MGLPMRPAGTLARTDPAAFARLKENLAVVVSAEALFVLTDLCGLTPEAAIAAAPHTTKTQADTSNRRMRMANPSGSFVDLGIIARENAAR